jgi:aspartate/methionine/tyrosine aminotransferase
MVHQFLPFSVVTPLQEAGARALEQAMTNGYFDATREQYQHLRDKLMIVLEKAKLNPMLPDGGYFIIAKAQLDQIKEDADYSTFLTTKVGVTPIPMRAFFQKSSQADVQQYIRYNSKP